jgi:hypothetical protein
MKFPVLRWVSDIPEIPYNEQVKVLARICDFPTDIRKRVKPALPEGEPTRLTHYRRRQAERLSSERVDWRPLRAQRTTSL